MRVFLILFLLLASLTFSNIASAERNYDIVKCPKIHPSDLLDNYDVIFTGKAGYTFSIGTNIQVRDPLRGGYKYEPLHHAEIKVDKVYKGNIGKTAVIRYTSYYPFKDEVGVPKHATKALYYKRDYLFLANNTGITNTYRMDGCKISHYDLNGVNVNSVLYSIFPPEYAIQLKNKLKKEQKEAQKKIGMLLLIFLLIAIAVSWAILRRTPDHLKDISDTETQ